MLTYSIPIPTQNVIQTTKSIQPNNSSSISNNSDLVSKQKNLLLQIPQNVFNFVQKFVKVLIKNNQVNAQISQQLFIYNLDSSTSEQQIMQHFSKVGTVTAVYLPSSKKINRGFGYITMKDDYETNKAFELLNESWLDGQFIKIEIIQDCLYVADSQVNERLDIQKSISSKGLTENKKIEKYNQLYNQLINKNKYELLLLFDVDLFSAIKSSLNEIESTSERLVLNTVEIAAQNASQFTLIVDSISHSLKTLLYNEFINSGLFSKIETMLNYRIAIEEENKDIPFSILTEQLIRIYLLMQKGHSINQNTMKKYLYVIANSISNLIKIIQMQGRENLKNFQLNDNEEDEHINNRIDSISKLLDSLNSTAQYNDINCNIPIYDKKIYESVSQLIHINCPKNLNCEKNINVICLSSSILSLQASVLNILSTIALKIKGVQIYLDENHSILPHISSLLNKSLYIQQQQCKTEDQSQDKQIQSPSSIICTIQLLQILLIDNISHCQLAVITPKLTFALIKLCKYKYNQYELTTVLKIRRGSFACLSCIQEKCNEYMIEQISNEGLVSAHVEAIATAGGCCEENVNQIQVAMIKFNKLLQQIISIKRLEYMNKLDFVKNQEEQIEEIGGIEEIEALITNNSCVQFIMDEAIKIKKIILNIFLVKQ